ncbi:nucleotidyltransferase family protein [Parabacteroides sp.]
MAENATISKAPGSLSPEHLQIVRQILERSTHVQSAIIFGSRAKGTNKPGSDIDLAIKGAEVGKDDIAALWAAFEESLLPFFVDVISYESIRNPDLKAHIDRAGISIYQR